ncbi:hypothetical protein T265_13145 [Opisthorchis viverrini]|uniref:Jumonji domain-containing protein 4 n=1 Tax=Opisthorchis viverrini TaxID=6198 RepID=A0A074ZXL8_OPIVI|nr:hypothetical protein T265_13145 [Opisthorchis viverrini]KER30657.1 hypothetical protein T265_13145 [Opisthorchis viverrini]
MYIRNALLIRLKILRQPTTGFALFGTHQLKFEMSEFPLIITPISLQEFYLRFMLLNKPCIFGQWITEGWLARRLWCNAIGDIDIERIFQPFPRDRILCVGDCSRLEFDAHPSIEMTVADYLTYWRDFHQGTDDRTLYLKDWHYFKATDTEYYQVPTLFMSDWMNEFWRIRPDVRDDFRFVYLGTKGTWTPLHADVYHSYSWSANISGIKRWWFFPPGEETKLKRNGRVPNDIRNIQLDNGDINYVQIDQHPGQVVFVPSGWYHQVVNLIPWPQPFEDGDVRTFLEDFEEVAEAAWLETDRGKLAALKTLLKDRAKAALDAARKGPRKMDWAAAKEVLAAELDTPVDRQEAMRRFKTARMAPGSDPTVFFAGLQQLLDRALPTLGGVSRHQLLSDQFVEGVQPALGAQLRLARATGQLSVEELTDCLSINHNWFNATNVNWVWQHLQNQLVAVEASTEDVRDTPGWREQCQICLRALAGIDFFEYALLLKYILFTRWPGNDKPPSSNFQSLAEEDASEADQLSSLNNKIDHELIQLFRREPDHLKLIREKPKCWMELIPEVVTDCRQELPTWVRLHDFVSAFESLRLVSQNPIVKVLKLMSEPLYSMLNFA